MHIPYDLQMRIIWKKKYSPKWPVISKEIHYIRHEIEKNKWKQYKENEAKKYIIILSCNWSEAALLPYMIICIYINYTKCKKGIWTVYSMKLFHLSFNIYNYINLRFNWVINWEEERLDNLESYWYWGRGKIR